MTISCWLISYGTLLIKNYPTTTMTAYQRHRPRSFAPRRWRPKWTQRTSHTACWTRQGCDGKPSWQMSEKH